MASPQTVIPAEAGISGDGAGKEPHEIPAFAGMTDLGGITEGRPVLQTNVLL